MAQLQAIVEDFRITDNNNLTTTDLSQLQSVGTDVRIYNNRLTSIDLPQLQSVVRDVFEYTTTPT